MTMVPTEQTAGNGNGYAVEQYQQPAQQSRFLPAQQVAAGKPEMTLIDWANQMQAAGQLANALVRTSFVPEAFRGKVDEGAAAILTGFDLGLSPTASLRAIYVIKGTPAMYARAMQAVLQSKGHSIWVEEATATRVVVKGHRRGEAHRVQTSVWTLDRAKTAELLSNAQYKKNPQNMLRARATGECCWMVAPDALHGIGASVEELGEDPAGEYGEATETAPAAEPAKRTAKRKPLDSAPAADLEPETVRATAEVGEAASPPPADSEPLTRAQQGKMFALFGEKGITSPTAQRDFVASVIGRQIASRSDLTKGEAKAVIDALEQVPMATPDVDMGGAELDDPAEPVEGELQ